LCWGRRRAPVRHSSGQQAVTAGSSSVGLQNVRCRPFYIYFDPFFATINPLQAKRHRGKVSLPYLDVLLLYKEANLTEKTIELNKREY
jgi:hypothetical protein